MKLFRYSTGLLLAALLCFACGESNIYNEWAKFDTTADTAWGQSIVDGCNGYIGHVKSDTTYRLSQGVDVLEMAYLNQNGHAMKFMLFRVQLSDRITIRTTLADDRDAVGKGQTIMGQLEAMKANGKKVLGGTNADFFSMTTFIPYGVCYRDGVCVKGTFSRDDCNIFAILKDNTAVCLTAAEYDLYKNDIRESVCGRSSLLLKNGSQLDQSTNSMSATALEPRTVIGCSQDGREVYLMVIDGRNYFYSNGADLYDLMDLMQACGASDALNLDGGGSSTFIALDSATGKFSLRNRPTDAGGIMRKVATGLAIVEQ